MEAGARRAKAAGRFTFGAGAKKLTMLKHIAKQLAPIVCYGGFAVFIIVSIGACRCKLGPRDC